MGTLWLDRCRRPTGRARRLHALGPVEQMLASGGSAISPGTRFWWRWTGSRTVLQWSDDAGQASAEPYPQELVEDNRRFYDSLWSGCRLVEPNRFNTWPLVQSLLRPAGLRLEVAPGLRPRLPIEDTQFVDISAPALEQLRARGGRVTLGSDCAAVRCGIV